jgi:hypothetical protein
MDTQSAAKLPFNFKIVPVNGSGIPVGVPFLAMFNPEHLTITEDVKWNPQDTSGHSSAAQNFIQVKPRRFSVELTIDGTGVNTNGVKIPVTAQVLLFRATTTSLQGLLHQPAFLLVQYGLFISTCVIESSTVDYTMFDFTGLPIRAKITASFKEHTPSTLSSILDMLSSPDLTHSITVQQGDLLPLITYQTYNDQSYYLQVAKVNKLKNFRKLEAGSTLVLPPIK